MFFKQVVQKLEQRDKYGYNIEDIKDEIFDMAKPDVIHALTLKDLIHCG